MRVLLVTTWDIPCGIAEHSWYLKQAVEAADPEIEIVPDPMTLRPDSFDWLLDPPDILHLNYQAALLSRWTPGLIAEWRAKTGVPIVVTYHDTGVPNSDHCRAICAAADAVVVHEPAEDLGPVYYWRMGVPPARWPIIFDQRRYQAVLGSLGFPFPWKHYDQLAALTARIGWGLLLIAPGASAEQIATWTRLNPATEIHADFVPRAHALSLLTGCDATAFPYVTHNTGQSAAILQGIAARKPVFAFHTCRQFRALYADPLARRTIGWVETFEELQEAISWTPLTGRPFAPMVALAEQESWAHLGERYARLYRELTP